MKLTADKQRQLDEAYETLIQVCLYDRPLSDMEPLLAEDVMNFGAGKKEITKTKKAFLQQIQGQKELAAGLKMEFKFEPVLRKITSEGNGAIYSDDIVNTVWIDGIKTDLKFRLSFIFEYVNDKWMLVHSHTSSPDSQRTDNEVWPVEELKKRTAVLEKSLEDKIAELEIKNRELEIEAALERVRAVAMSILKPEDLAVVSEIIFTELKTLGFSKLRNTEIIINKNEKESIVSYYYSDYGITGRIEVPYNQNPVLYKWATEMQQAPDAFVAVTIPEHEMDAWRLYREQVGYLPDPKLNAAKAVFYYSYSIGMGALSVSTWEPLSEDTLKILERFRNVFGLAYRRYADVAKAEAQAREAQIETVLERVRARTMAMQKSDELSEAASILFKQIADLGTSSWSSGFDIWEENGNAAIAWMANPDGSMGSPFLVPYTEDSFFKKIHKARQSGNDFFVMESGGKELEDTYQYLFNLPSAKKHFDGIKALGFQMPSYQITHCAFFSHGFLMFITYEPVPEMWDIFKRFAKVFEQTYTRFLDLQMAEDQAWAARIEAALERTRTQSMLMQHSSELDNTLRVFHEQVLLLGISSAFSFLWLPDEKNDRHIFWASWAENVSNDLLNKNSVAFKSKAIDYPLDRNEPATAQCLIDWKGMEPVVSYHVPPAGVEAYFSAWQELIAGVEQLRPEYFSDGLYYVEAFMKYGCFGVLVKRELPDEEKKILYRFAIEFERAYTRFLDLQKAEAQTREARIEAALERVRSRAMAMQNTEELVDAADLVGKELSGLGINSMNVSYAFMDEKEQKASYYSVNPLDGKIMPFSFAFPHTETEVMRTILASWKRQEPFNVLELDEESTLKHQTWAGGYIKYIFDVKGVPFSMEEFIKISPKKAVIYTFNFTNGYLFAIGDARFTAAQEDIVLRVTKVFDLTYRRFLDLKQAESQAKEAQIEAALERVRSRSMGMQKSEELKEVIQVVYEQFVHLNIHIEHTGFVMDFKLMGDWNFWIADRNGTPAEIKVPYFDSVWGNSFNDAKQKGLDFFATHLNFEEKNNFYGRLLSFIPGLPEETRQFYFSCAGLAVSTVLLENVALYIENFSGIPYSTEENAILMRFGKVFEQTYTRFLDLKKAEAQARESQIEAALERVRSRTMAMQKSSELADVAGLIFAQVKEMGINTWTTGFNVWSDDNNSYQDYITSPSGGFIDPYIVDTTAAEALMEISEARKSGKEFVVLYAGGEKIEKLYRALTASAHLQFEKMLEDGVRFPSEQYEHFVFGGKVSLMFITYDPVPNAHDIFRRFGKVFEQTYTRFLDLKTAEAQTRESQIQLALERVRARTMAMQHSNELPQAANLLFQQVQSLGMPTWSAGYCLWEDSKNAATFYMSSEGEIQIPFSMPLTEEPALMHMREGSESASLFYVDELEGELCSSHYTYMRTLPGINEILDALIDSGFPLPTYQINHMAYFPQGFLLFITYEPVPEAHDIFKRFAKVFEQTYTRFLDLERAEAQGLEAIKRASVDRVRAEIASMRTTADLEKITPLIWNELTTLGVPFIRCGVFIMDEEEQQVNTYLSNPEGKAIAAFHQPYDSPGDIAEVVKSWRKKEMYKRHWDEAMFVEVTKNLVQQGGITSGEKYLTENHPTDLYLHFLPFLQGMLYVGNISPLKETELQLVQNLADAFSTAYARYEDFNKLEAAKEQVDKTLTDLKQAQAQLVQAEKMASLGELTAGIAHEIQNPLNFVNNFSEVNAELSEEIMQAAINGNIDEIKLLAADIKLNQEKIREHGKRADSIVKGMLQHSRTSSGEKIPTDINALADEYLRLAYHGFRAKDKTFNSALNTDFDTSIGNLNIIPQDIGRVLLNLINNAFYTVAEKSKSNGSGYQPIVTISSKKLNDNIEIKVADNGNGIPVKVLDKIFQPFFTTKPTGQGTGLGLSLSYDIVKANGGELIVTSEEGKGACFIINLPGN